MMNRTTALAVTVAVLALVTTPALARQTPALQPFSVIDKQGFGPLIGMPHESIGIRRYAVAKPSRWHRRGRTYRRFKGDAPVTRHAGNSSHGNICTKVGRCATVIASASSNFQGLIHELESMGYNIGSPGCLSGGHMRNSKHHWGGACDLFNQIARNRAALPMPSTSVQIALAERYGLISGCKWSNPDCAHFEVPGWGGRVVARAHVRTRYARRTHHRYAGA